MYNKYFLIVYFYVIEKIEINYPPPSASLTILTTRYELFHEHQYSSQPGKV